MITGYTRPLYLLPFDHRASYISGLYRVGKECVQKEKTGCPTYLPRRNLSRSGFVLNLVAQEVKLFADLRLANSTPTPVSGEWAPQSVARTSRSQF
jgi:hypothetical protein